MFDDLIIEENIYKVKNPKMLGWRCVYSDNIEHYSLKEVIKCYHCVCSLGAGTHPSQTGEKE